MGLEPPLKLGQKLSPSEQHTTEFAAARAVEPAQTGESAALSKPTPAVMYGPPQWARPSFTHGFPGSAFTLQSDGTLRCPADHPLYSQERRPERDGSLRILLVCCADRPLSNLSLAWAVSRKQRHDQAEAS